MKDDKIVCACMSVTIGDIRKSVKEGAKTFEEMQDVTGASQGCGRCRDYAKNVFNALLEDINA